MTDWNIWLGIALGGALGALGRAVCVYATPPHGVLLANTAGCLALGLFAGQASVLPEWLRLALTAGFCGSLTTFSMLCAEAVQRYQEARGVLGAALLLGLHLALGYAALSLGLAAGR